MVCGNERGFNTIVFLWRPSRPLVGNAQSGGKATRKHVAFKTSNGTTLRGWSNP